MPTARQLHRLATRPADYHRFLLTGRLPEGVKPNSPLLDVLRQLGGRDLAAMRGFTVDASLGYAGSRRFATAAQAMHWLAPSDEVFGAFPAESWRIKGFRTRLSLDDVLACCASYPDRMLQDYARLRRSQP